MFPFLAVCLVVSSITAMSSSLSVPRSSVVIIGDRVELKCNGSDFTKWTFTAWNTSTETDIYLGGYIVNSMRSRYKADRNISGQHNLIIDSVDWDHAGRYRCIAVMQETLSADIQLTVLGSNPVCAANTTEAHVDGNKQTHLRIWCSISYTGNGFPVFSWTKSNAEKIISVNTTTSGSSQGPVTKTSLIIQQLHANDIGVTLQCQITFQIPDNSESAYVYTWNYSPFLVVTSSYVVVAGNRVEIKCSVTGSDSASWTYTAWNTSTDRYIYFGGQIVVWMRSRYKIDKRISGQHNLIIDSVDFTYAGRYRCIAVIQETVSTDIQLTVLGSSPECSANTSRAGEGNIQHGYLWMWCRTIYTGNTVPIFTWTKDKTMDTIIANTTTASGTSRSPLTKTSSVNRQLSSNDNGATFKCKITFQSPIIPKGKATEYENIWSYTLYGPRNLNIVEYEDRLECSADGNPPPTYGWKRVDMKSSMEGPVFILDDKEQTFQCTATNVFASEKKNFKPTKDKISAWGLQTVGLVLIIPTLIVFGIVVLGIGLKLRKLSIAFDEDKASARKSSLQPQQSSQRLDSPPPTDEYAEVQMASDNYYALADRSAAAQQTEVYCELRTIPNKHQAVN